MSSKEKPVQGEAGAWRVRPHDTDLSAARVINDARLAESMAAHRWLVEPLTELPTPAESQPQGVEADEHRMMMDDLRLYGTAFSKNGKRIPPEDVYITHPPAPAAGDWMEQFGNMLAIEGTPRLIDAWNKLHTPAAQSEVSPANTSPTIAAPGLTPTLLQSLGDVERGALTPAQRELLGQVKNTHMAYVAQAHTKTQSEYHASVVDAISAALRSQGQGQADAVELRGVRDTLIVAANNPVSHGGLGGLRELMLTQAHRITAALAQQANKEQPPNG